MPGANATSSLLPSDAPRDAWYAFLRLSGSYIKHDCYGHPLNDGSIVATWPLVWIHELHTELAEVD